MDLLKELFLSRMKRNPFWWKFLLCNIVSALMVSLISTINDIILITSGTTFSKEIEGFFVWITVIIITFYQVSLIVRRCHDAGFSWWLTGVTVIMSIIPVISLFAFIILLCTKSTKGYNQFGDEL